MSSNNSHAFVTVGTVAAAASPAASATASVKSMSSSIPIPPRPSKTRSASAALPDASLGLGKSLPARPKTALHTAGAGAGAAAAPPHPRFASQDDLAAKSVQLITRSARRWQSVHSPPATSRPSLRFNTWDFSEVVTATDQVCTAIQEGAAIAKRPARAGVSGTYFFCRQEDQQHALGVFKPMDEEAESIDMSPPPPMAQGAPVMEPLDFSLGPAHSSMWPSPATSPNRSFAFHKAASISSDSDNESRALFRANGFYQGEGAYREVAAYLLDHDRFARVPQTALVQWLRPYGHDLYRNDVSGSSGLRSDDSVGHTCLSDGDSDFGESEQEEDDISDTDDSGEFEGSTNGEMSFDHDKVNVQTKRGAFQVFVPNLGDADDFGPGVFDKDQVHRIAVLDIRTLNWDRHGGNILVTKSSSSGRRYDLIPIDHGYILPDGIHNVPWPVWMDWPMIRQPLSEEVKRYIHYLDAETDARRLTDELNGVLRAGALQSLKIATALLQKGVAAGLTLYDIGLLMYSRREDPLERSELEKIVNEAQEASSARDRHIAEKKLMATRGFPDDTHHRRHQSMNALDSCETLVDEYVVKYASRRVQELVTRVADAKAKARETWAMPRPSYLTRARSIPDFGIGEKPLHTILEAAIPNESGQMVPAPTPASSPMAVDRSKPHGFDLDEQFSSAPIQIPINDVRVDRIALPGQHQHGGNGCVTPVLTNKHAQQLDIGDAGGGRPPIAPLFNKPQRKASPVSPMDMYEWNSSSHS